MRQRLVMGNWKLNGTKETVVSLIKAFAAEANKYPKVEAAICAPAIFIGLVEENAKGSRLAWGSEDVDFLGKDCLMRGNPRSSTIFLFHFAIMV